MLKVLIAEGNPKELRDKGAKLGIIAQSDLYQQTLTRLAKDVECEIVYPADEDAPLPSPAELAEFDGFSWTGSGLNLYNRSVSVDRQIDLMKRMFEVGGLIFGSCWGMQVATVAAGGEVAANVAGREIGLACDLRLTEEGRKHPLYKGKPPAFNAVAIHVDHIVKLPKGATVLSGNDVSQIQAIEIRKGKSVFWGVQYHPEFDLEYIAGLIKRYKANLVEEGICKNEAEAEKWARDFVRAGRGQGGEDLKRKYCLDDNVLDPRIRLRELSNWLAFLREEKGRRKNKNRAPEKILT